MTDDEIKDIAIKAMYGEKVLVVTDSSIKVKLFANQFKNLFYWPCNYYNGTFTTYNSNGGRIVCKVCGPNLRGLRTDTLYIDLIGCNIEEIISITCPNQVFYIMI